MVPVGITPITLTTLDGVTVPDGYEHAGHPWMQTSADPTGTEVLGMLLL